MCIYEKNSDAYFDEEYIVDYSAGDRYYLSEAGALNELSEVFGIDFADIDEALILVEEHNNKDENDDDQIYVHKFELVD
jgi:ssDNA-specific exonuclease RecJ